jgi:hypothetical protein
MDQFLSGISNVEQFERLQPRFALEEKTTPSMFVTTDVSIQRPS